MSEEVAQPAGDIAHWRKRAIEAEVKAQILEAQLGGWEAQCAAQVEAALAYLGQMGFLEHTHVQLAARHQLVDTIETDAGRLLLAKLQLYQERLKQAQAWIRKAGHLDDCALQYGGACSCGKSDLTRGDGNGS